ncbi:hypothetical protein ACJX0J_020552, partial [Zea mays]
TEIKFKKSLWKAPLHVTIDIFIAKQSFDNGFEDNIKNLEDSLREKGALKTLKDKCFNFAARCTARLKSIFNLVRASFEEANLFAKDIPKEKQFLEIICARKAETLAFPVN